MGQNSGLLSSLTDWNSTLAGYADSISTGVVMPVALTLLALFMILELYNATQRIAMNGSSNAFTIQQIALVMMKIVVCRWAVLHTTEILNALFEIASTVTTGISGYVGSGEVNTTVDIENAIAALPGGIGNMPVALELMVGQNSGLLSNLTDWNSTLAGYADSISTGVVMPVALTLLALFMILELYNATQRIAMNGSSNAFTIQQIALVMMKIVVCRWAVLHTTEILNALFEIASTVTTGISGYVGSGEVNTTVDIENAIAALPGGIGNMPVALELMVVGWMLRIVNIVVNTIVAARFIELYVYNAMASLSIATLCYQELHGIAVNFLKSYLAVALQGAVLYLVIGFYPALAGSLGTGGSITEQAWAMLGQSVILLVAVFMSGKFTKAITNAMT